MHSKRYSYSRYRHVWHSKPPIMRPRKWGLMDFGNFRDKSVKIGNDRKRSLCLPENVDCIPLATVVIMTSLWRSLTERKRYFPEGIKNYFIISDLYLSRSAYRHRTKYFEVHLTTISLNSVFHTCTVRSTLYSHTIVGDNCRWKVGVLKYLGHS